MMKFVGKTMNDVKDIIFDFDEMLKSSFGFSNVSDVKISMDEYDYHIVWSISNFEWINEISISIEEDFYIRFKINGSQMEYDELTKKMESESNLVKKMIYEDIRTRLENSFRCY